MRFLTILTLLQFVFVGAAVGDVILDCTVPTDAIPRAQAMCDLVRVDMRVTTANWSNDACASEFLRRGLRDYDAGVVEKESRETVRNDVRDALATFDADFPRIPRAFCGDNTIDSEFGEICDDGNQISRDGCSDSCDEIDDVCGDSVIDPTEQCDDGNRVEGDGCDDDCQVE
jgi:cysteine-rich repeat protein